MCSSSLSPVSGRITTGQMRVTRRDPGGLAVRAAQPLTGPNIHNTTAGAVVGHVAQGGGATAVIISGRAIVIRRQNQ